MPQQPQFPDQSQLDELNQQQAEADYPETAKLTLDDGSVIQVRGRDKDDLRNHARQILAASRTEDSTSLPQHLALIARDLNNSVLGWAMPLVQQGQRLPGALGDMAVFDRSAYEAGGAVRPEGVEPHGIAGHAADVAGMVLPGVGAVKAVDRMQGVGQAVRGTLPTRASTSAAPAAPVTAAEALPAGRAATTAQTLKDLPANAARSFRDSPGRFAASEAGGAAALGAAGESLREGGAPEPVAAVGEMAAGIAGGAVPYAAGAARQFSSTVANAVKRNILPWSEEGGMLRASQAVQGDITSDPQSVTGRARLESAVADIDAAPDGISPARALQDQAARAKLMSREAAVFDQFPELETLQRERLIGARDNIQAMMRDEAGSPRNTRDWVRTAVQNSVPEGVEIKTKFTDTMLREAKEGFDQAYQVVRGTPVGEKAVYGLGHHFRAIVDDQSLMVTDNNRNAVRNFLDDQMTKIRPPTDGTIDLGDLTAVRQSIREKMAVAARRGGDNNWEKHDLLSQAEEVLSATIKRATPDDVAETLAAIDGKYHMFKFLEGAAARAGDNEVKWEHLSAEIGHQVPKGWYARGGDATEAAKRVEEMRQLVQIGRPVRDYMNDDPDNVRRIVRDFTPGQREEVQREFFDELIGRSMAQDSEGGQMISGRRLLAQIDQNRASAKAMGLDADKVANMRKLAKQLKMAQDPSSNAARSISDGTLGSIVDFIARWGGARAGAQSAAGLSGASIQMANVGANKFVKAALVLTIDQERAFLVKAYNDPEMMKMLLLRANGPTKKLADASQRIRSYAIAAAAEQVEDIAEQQMEGGGSIMTGTITLDDGTQVEVSGRTESELRRNARMILYESRLTELAPEEAGTE